MGVDAYTAGVNAGYEGKRFQVPDEYKHDRVKWQCGYEDGRGDKIIEEMSTMDGQRNEALQH